jgi:glutamate dehydrogenase/leucine dehydrogenase
MKAAAMVELATRNALHAAASYIMCAKTMDGWDVYGITVVLDTPSAANTVLAARTLAAVHENVTVTGANVPTATEAPGGSTVPPTFTVKDVVLGKQLIRAAAMSCARCIGCR